LRPRLWNQADQVTHHLGDVGQVRLFTPVSLSFPNYLVGMGNSYLES
jgi:hypothetical protein